MQVSSFDDYNILVRPLPSEDSRVFDCGRNKVCYRAYQIALAEQVATHSLAILVEHGAGKEVHWIPNEWICKQPLLDLAARDERALYAILFSLYKASCDAASTATVNTKALYERAFVDGRLKKRKYPARGITKVWIENV